MLAQGTFLSRKEKIFPLGMKMQQADERNPLPASSIHYPVF
jgi:hypothetical protein